MTRLMAARSIGECTECGKLVQLADVALYDLDPADLIVECVGCVYGDTVASFAASQARWRVQHARRQRLRATLPTARHTSAGSRRRRER